MMKQFKVPTKSPSVQASHDRRIELIEKSRSRDNKRAVRALKAEYRLKVYTPKEVKAFVSERPELLTREVIGHSDWDLSKANFSY